jgi:hypothetical protein
MKDTCLLLLRGQTDMNYDGRKLLCSSLALATFLCGTAALAEGKRQIAQGMGRPPMPMQTPAPPMAGVKKFQQRDGVRQQVVTWFTAYDNIRHEAQMTPQEKNQSHELMAAVISGNDGNKAAGKVLLQKMVTRYTKAISQLGSLKSIPQTAALQDGYRRYFSAGRDFFSRYLKALNQSNPEKMLSAMQTGRSELGALDMSNKALDRKLRKQFDIKPYRW